MVRDGGLRDYDLGGGRVDELYLLMPGGCGFALVLFRIQSRGVTSQADLEGQFHAKLAPI